MLCLPGFVPVWNEDHATGEMDGSVVPSGLKQPCLRSASRCGSFPSASIRSVSVWSRPSSPSTTTRLNRPRGAPPPKSARHSRRIGQVRSISSAEKNAAITGQAAPAMVKPAPGPM